MFGYGEKLKVLEEQKEGLLKNNNELRTKINEIEELTKEFDELWETEIKQWNGHAGSRGGQYGIMRNLKDFEQWKETVFWKYREELNFPNTWTLKRLPERELVGNDIIRPEWKWNFDFNICAYCDMVLPTSQGPIVHIKDPFGEYTLPPAKNISNEVAQELIDSLILASCIMRYYQKDYEVLGFKKLPYTMYNRSE